MDLLEDTDLRRGHRSEAVHGFESYKYNRVCSNIAQSLTFFLQYLKITHRVYSTVYISNICPPIHMFNEGLGGIMVNALFVSVELMDSIFDEKRKTEIVLCCFSANHVVSRSKKELI